MDFCSARWDGVMAPDRENAIYQTMMDLSTDIVFEWDMETDRFSCSSKWCTRFGYTPLSANFFTALPASAHLHPDDLALLHEQIEQFRQGKAFGEAIVRILGSNERYTWNRIRASAQRTADGRLCKLIGVISDIDSEQRNSQALLAKTEQDSLTGLLNKDAARRRIDNYLAHADEHQRAAMLIIDLDNFKAVNDQFGHLFGDNVLSRVASTIRSLFREKDITARIGGDEFLVFMMDIPDWELAERRCEKLTKALQQLYDCKLQSCQFSCSIGIAIMPEHGTGYQELFQRADRALYQAKDMGKNTYACYTADATHSRYETKISHRIESEEIRIDSFGPLAVHLLETLYETNDLSATIHSTMKILGMQLQADRVFVCDASGQNFFTWNKSGIPHSQQMDLQLHEVIRSGAVEKLFVDEDVFYCHDSSTMPEPLLSAAAARHTEAMLLCASRNNGQFTGLVGMETHANTRLWTREEIDALTSFAHVTDLLLWRKD